MISFNRYQQLIVDKVKNVNRPRLGFEYEPGDIVGFLFSPKKGDKATTEDLFVLCMVIEMRSAGGGKGIWGVNLYNIPGVINRDRMGEMLMDETTDNIELGVALYRNSVTRKAFKYYHLRGIEGQVIKFKPEELKQVL